MAEKQLNARIVLKYDTLANWNASSVVLKAGEMAIATVASATAGTFDGDKTPVVGIKVGDGTHTFANLQWIQGIAGDVYAWAKASTKPTYTADEISGLADYISGEINDTNTTYTFAEGSTNGAFSVTPSGGSAQSVSIHGLGSAAYTASTAYAAAAYETKVDTLIGSDTGKSVRTIANEELAVQLIPANADASLDTLQEIAAWIQSHPDDASQMATNIAALKSALSSFITDTSGTYSATADAVKDYVDTAISGVDASTQIATEIAKLDSSVSATAASGDIYSVLTGVTETDGKLSAKTEVTLAAIAKTGNVNDLIQTSGDVVVLNCGSSSVNV